MNEAEEVAMRRDNWRTFLVKGYEVRIIRVAN